MVYKSYIIKNCINIAYSMGLEQEQAINSLHDVFISNMHSALLTSGL